MAASVTRVAPVARTVVLAAVGAVAAHAAFFAWDRTLGRNLVTGALTGPYETWQVVGCGLALALMAGVGGYLRQPLATAASLAVAYTCAWSVSAANAQVDGVNLWPVGAMFLMPAVFMGTSLFAYWGSAERNRIGSP